MKVQNRLAAAGDRIAEIEGPPIEATDARMTGPERGWRASSSLVANEYRIERPVQLRAWGCGGCCETFKRCNRTPVDGGDDLLRRGLPVLQPLCAPPSTASGRRAGGARRSSRERRSSRPPRSRRRRSRPGNGRPSRRPPPGGRRCNQHARASLDPVRPVQSPEPPRTLVRPFRRRNLSGAAVRKMALPVPSRTAGAAHRQFRPRGAHRDIRQFLRAFFDLSCLQLRIRIRPVSAVVGSTRDRGDRHDAPVQSGLVPRLVAGHAGKHGQHRGAGARPLQPHDGAKRPS